MPLEAWETQGMRRRALVVGTQAAAMKRHALCMHTDALRQSQRTRQRAARCEELTNLIELYRDEVIGWHEIVEAGHTVAADGARAAAAESFGHRIRRQLGKLTTRPPTSDWRW